jgi:hypothetical protein
MRLHHILLLSGLLAASATDLQGQVNPSVVGADLRPRVDAGQIVTDAFDDLTAQLVPNVRTFGWQFQTIPTDPYFLQDPGFNAVAGSGLPAGSQLGFDVTRSLSWWDGTGGVIRFRGTPAAESLTFNFGGGTVTISDGSGAQNGFNVATVASNGSTHRHLNAFLNAGTLAAPTPGVYLTSIRTRSSAAAVGTSDALFWLFNNGIQEADFRRALTYVANPFPGDADFSGDVDIADFSTLAANFNAAGPLFWYDGDFDNDRAVSIGDFALLASNFNRTAPPTPADLPRGAVVPEPSLLFSIAGVAGVALLRGRRQ